jgi:hypothetical protein
LLLKNGDFLQVDKIVALFFATTIRLLLLLRTLVPSNETETGTAGEQWFDKAHQPPVRDIFDLYKL